MAPSGVVVLSAAQTLSTEFLVKAARGAPVQVDAATLDRVAQSAPKRFEPADPTEDAAANTHYDVNAPLRKDCVDPVGARAAVVAALAALLPAAAGAARPELLTFLADLINADIYPAIPTTVADGAAAGAIVAVCRGAGTTLVCDAPTPAADALAAKGLTAPDISAAERALLGAGNPTAAALCVRQIEDIRDTAALSEAVAALAFEALGAPLSPLSREVLEASQSTNAAAAADAVREMLDGSKLVDVRKGGCGPIRAVTSAPNVFGSLREAIASAHLQARSGFQASAVLTSKGVVAADPSPALAQAVLGLAQNAIAAASLSAARVEAILAATGSAPPSSSEGGEDSANNTPPPLEPAIASLAGHARSGLDLARALHATATMGLSAHLCCDPSGPQRPPTLAAAHALGAARVALEAAVAAEAMASVLALRQTAGEATPEELEAAVAAEASTGDDAAANTGGGSKKDKKDKKKKVKGLLALGKGTAFLRRVVEAEIAAASGGQDDLTRRFVRLTLAADAAAGPCVAAVAAALSPGSRTLAAILDTLRGMIEANQARRKPKIAKGARDFLPDQMTIRGKAFDLITRVFKRHGAVSIDTPVFELRETLTGKYGEDSKLIYDLADQGGELLSLRYDLTVPFARYVALHSVGNIKRYQIARVYRRDQPQMNRGRFREFFQCDLDIAGAYPSMVPDAEVLKVLVEILADLRIGEFEVKLSHRRLLNAMLDIAGVPAQKFKPICSAIDKLDKEPWEAVRSEMVGEKGLTPESADRIGEMVVLRGAPLDMIAQLSAHPDISKHPEGAAAIEELRTMFGYMQAMDCLGPVCLDLSLARGLDYYTGVIYEAVLKGAHVGSIAAGGRYDKLVGMFSGKDVPAVGVSIGIERVFAIMEAQMRERAEKEGVPIRETETDVLVCSIGSGHQPRRMELCSRLWAAGIRAEFGYKANPKMGDQLPYALAQGIPLLVIFGGDEIERGVVKVKDLAAKQEEEVPAGEELVQYLKGKIAALEAAAGDGMP
ncbi:unnamed protein product [Pedinophyceae sp. YPF-701]|nr:unnamed protein product [Pedinophyceae sp. YPF-701]